VKPQPVSPRTKVGHKPAIGCHLLGLYKPEQARFCGVVEFETAGTDINHNIATLAANIIIWQRGNYVSAFEAFVIEILTCGIPFAQIKC
jgi:hypothetical protein